MIDWETFDKDWIRGQGDGWRIAVFESSALAKFGACDANLEVQLDRDSSNWPLVVEELEPTIRRFFCRTFDKEEFYDALDEGIRRWGELHESATEVEE